MFEKTTEPRISLTFPLPSNLEARDNTLILELDFLYQEERAPLCLKTQGY